MQNSQNDRDGLEKYGIWVAIVAAIIAMLQVINMVMDTTVKTADVYADVSDLVDRADKRIEKLIGSAQPNSAVVYGLVGEDTGKVEVQVDLIPMRAIDLDGLYQVSIGTNFKVEAEGENGLLLGFNYKFEGPILDVLAVGPGKQPIAAFKNRLARFSVQQYNQNQRRIILEGVGTIAQVTSSVRYLTCTEAKETIERILSLNGNAQDSKVYAQPILERIRTQPKAREFQMVFEKGVDFPCEKYAAM